MKDQKQSCESSVLEWANSEKSLLEYEATGVIATLSKQKDETKKRVSLWRAIFNLPAK